MDYPRYRLFTPIINCEHALTLFSRALLRFTVSRLSCDRFLDLGLQWSTLAVGATRWQRFVIR